MSAGPRVVVAGLALALVLTSCSADADPEPAGDTTAPTATPAGATSPAAPGTPAAEDFPGEGEADEARLAALRAWFEALDEEARQEQVDDLSGTLERELYAASGLTAALGSDEAVDTSIAETAQWMADGSERVGSFTPRTLARAAALTPEPTPAPIAGPAAALRPSAAADQATTFGEGLFGGLLLAMLGADVAISRTNDGTVGTDTREGITIDAVKDRVSLSWDGSFTDSQGVTTGLRTRSTLLPCPLPDGTFTASAVVEVSSTTQAGRTGKRARFEVSVSGTVDDDARLAGYDVEYTSQLSDFRASRGAYVEMVGGWTRDGGGKLGVTRTGGAVSDALVKANTGLGILVSVLVASRLVDTAKAGWESGRCVSLEPRVSAGPRGLRPGASVVVTAAPRSKMDGGKVGGTVAARLSSGQAGVTPEAAPADATFTYLAPGEADASGTVALEARSRRGVAKASIVFDTASTSYTASGRDEVTFSGTVASVTAPFTVQGTFPGGTAQFRFDGASERGGVVRIGGGGSGARLTGRGTYTVTPGDDGVLVLDLRVRSCVDVSGVCRRTTHRITLTPKR